MFNRSETISPTAHMTGYVWHRQGWSHPALVTGMGRIMYYASRPALLALEALGNPSLEDILVARHRAIDQLLAAAIDAGRIGQVIEVAAGLSPRGWDFARRYGTRIRYIEADLPQMAGIKRRRLQGTGSLSDHHRVVTLDALADVGPESLASLAATLDPAAGTAIVTEGLLNYFDEASVLGIWRRFAAALGNFPEGLYLSDLHLRGENQGLAARGFLRFLSTVVRGQVHLHFDTPSDCIDALHRSGFAAAAAHRPHEVVTLQRPDRVGGGVRILEARC